MKLLTKYSTINLMAMVIIFLISSGVIYFLMEEILIREMDSDLSGIEEKVRAHVARFNVLPQGFPLDEERISFVATGGQKVDRQSQMTQLYSAREKKMHNFWQLVFPLRLNNVWYRVTVAKPLEGMHHLSRAVVRISSIAILAVILISIALNSFFLRRLWKPFYKSMSIMRNFRLGRTGSLSFPSTTIEEFSFMNENLLLATQKADQDYLLLKEFTENASHEMQTPLSIIRSKLDVLIQEKGLSEKQSELAGGAYAAIKRLSRLNHSLLLLAKIENHQFEKAQTIDLKEKVQEKIAQFQELWQSHHIETHCSLQESTIDMSPELLDILLNNLLSNASNHNISHGYISVELERNRMTVRNTGLPVSLDEKRLFERFYKEAVNSNSNGLGLSIVKQISKASSIDTSYQFKDRKHSFILSW